MEVFVDGEEMFRCESEWCKVSFEEGPRQIP